MSVLIWITLIVGGLIIGISHLVSRNPKYVDVEWPVHMTVVGILLLCIAIMLCFISIPRGGG